MTGEQHTGATASGVWRNLSVRHLFLLVPWVGVVIAASRPIRDNSFLWHVRAGELQLDSGEVLRSDPFSFTFAGQPWRTQSWLADILYGWLERVTGGLDWVPWLLIACGGLVMLLAGFVASRRLRQSLPVALALLALIWLGLPNFVPRPVLFSFVLLALLALALEVDCDWAAPLILWVWAGLHGTFVIGLGLLVLDSVRRRLPVQRALSRAGFSMAAVSLTAHGIGVWGILGGFLANRDALSYISEWAPPNLLSAATFPYLLLLAGVIVSAARGRITLRDTWLVIPFLIFGLTSARAVFPAALVLAPYAATALRRDPGPQMRPVSTTLAFVNWFLAAALLLAPLATLASFRGLDEDRFPLEAAHHLREEPTWHDDATGGYLIFEKGPAFKVFVDDRAELYGASFFEDFVNSRRGTPQWRTVFDRYEIGQALVAREMGLAAVLSEEGWIRTYEDGSWAVFAAP